MRRTIISAPDLAESLITSLASAPRGHGAVARRGRREPPAESRSRQLRARARCELPGDRLGAADRRSPARDAESRAPRRVGGVGRNRRRHRPAICSTLQTRLATLLGNAIADQTPSGERAEPAAAITSSEPGAACLLEGPRAARSPRSRPATCRRRSQEFEARARRRSEVRDRLMPASPKRSGRCTCRPTTRRGRSARWSRPGRAIAARARSAERALHRRADAVSQRPIRRGAGRSSSARWRCSRPTKTRSGCTARVLMRQGEIDDGLAEFRKVMAHPPERGGGPHRHGRRRCTTRHDIQEALDAFEKAIALSPGSAISLTPGRRRGAAAGRHQARPRRTTNGPTPSSRARKRFRTWARSITAWATTRRPRRLRRLAADSAARRGDASQSRRRLHAPGPRRRCAAGVPASGGAGRSRGVGQPVGRESNCAPGRLSGQGRRRCRGACAACDAR